MPVVGVAPLSQWQRRQAGRVWLLSNSNLQRGRNMKLQSSIFRNSLLVLAVFPALPAAAQSTPDGSPAAQQAAGAKFPAAKSQASGAASADADAKSQTAREPKAEKDGPDAIRKREEWFHKQRASANGHIPSGAHRQAFQHMQTMMEKEGKLVRRADGTIQEVAPQGLALTTSWSPIGPSPTSGGFFSPVTGRITTIAIDPTDATGNTVLIGGAQGGIWRSTTAGSATPTWTPVGDQNVSLSMGSIAFAPSQPATVYAGTGEQASIGLDVYYGEGVLKSADGGQTWTQTCTTPSATCPFIGPFSDTTPFEFFTFGGARISYVAVNPSNPLMVLAAAQFSLSGNMEGVYCSADGGGTWTNVLPGQMSTFVGFASPTIAFAALGDPNGSGTGTNLNGIYKSVNASSCSMTFAAQTGATLPASSAMGRIDMGISPNFATDNTVYASISSSAMVSFTNLGVWATTNAGTSWTQTAATDICQQQCWYDNVVKVDPLGSAFFGGSSVAASTGAPMWVERTTNGGASWATVIPNLPAGSAGLPHVDNHAMAFIKLASGKVQMYLGNDGGIWRTDDAEAASVTWTNLNDSTLQLTQFYPALSVHPSSPNFAFAGAQDNGSQIYAAGSANWTDNDQCGDGTGTAIDNLFPSTVYVACNGNDIFASLQNGAAGTYLSAINGINLTENADFVPPLVTDPSTANTVYTGTTKVYQTVNGGVSWVALSADLVNGANGDDLTAMAVAPTNPAVVYAAADTGQIFVATNVAAGAGTFAAVAGQASLPPRRVNGIAVDSADSTGKTSYAEFSGFAFGTDTKGHLFKTADGGATWADVSCTVPNCTTPAVTDLPNTPVNDVVIDPNVPGTLYVGTDIGVFQGTCTATCSWTTLSTGLPRVAVLSLKLHAASRTLIAATHGRGAWDLLLSNTFTNPHISSISPVSASAGGATFTLTVNGVGLTGGSVLWNASATNVTTQQVSDTQLTATIASTLIASGGAPKITVNTTAGTSNALTFTVLGGGAPTITSVSPVSANVNAAATPITVTGSGFASNATVLMNPDVGGTAIPTTFVSATTLHATVPATFMANFGSTNSVGVQNPPPGGGTTFTTSTVTLPTFIVKATAPANDNFANAITVTPAANGSFTDTKDSSAATTETNDPTPPCSQLAGFTTGRSNTIWYKFTPATNGTISDVDTIGSSYDTVLSIWTGASQAALALVVCNDDINPGIVIQSQIQNLAVTAGTSYYIMVSSFGLPDANPQAFGGKSVFNLTFAGGGATGNFSIAGTDVTPAPVTAGSSGTSTITVTPGAGSTGSMSVNITCAAAGLPPGVTCTPNPLAIITTGTTAQTGTLTVTVAAPAAANAMASVTPQERTVYAAGLVPVRGGKGWWMLSAGTGLTAIILLFLPGRKRYRAALGLGLVCVLSFTLGCGSSGGGGGSVPVATVTHITVTSPTKAAAGATFTFTATVTGGTPTDMVQLMDGGVATGSPVAVVAGTATLSTAALSTVGTHSITAHYAGDPANTQASTSGALNVTVTGSTTVAIQSTPAASNGSPTINLTIN
jgi:hypothetical protein